VATYDGWKPLELGVMVNNSTEVVLNTRHYQIAAKVWGAEHGLPVLALHGWLDNAASFDFIAPLLKNIRLMAIDLPGHGLSQHKSKEAHYYLWEYVRDAVDVLNALGWQRCSLLGHSLGASIAALLAATFPARINSIALIDGLGPLAVDEEELPAHFAQALLRDEKPLRVSSYLTVDDAVEARIKNGLPLSEKAARVLVERALIKTDEGFAWRFDPRVKLPSPLRMSESQTIAFLQKITAPVCLVLDEQQIFSEQSYSKARQAAIRQLEVHYCTGGHHLHMDGDVQAVAQLLNGFFV
jgi:pimeloyl-ACP methyl ester carboxylesterase